MLRDAEDMAESETTWHGILKPPGPGNVMGVSCHAGCMMCAKNYKDGSMTKQLRSIGALSCAKVSAIIYGVIGLIIGAFVSLLSLLGAFGGALGSTGGEPAPPVFGLIFAVGAITYLPVLYACMGAIGGVIMAGVYNLVARLVGGIELEIE